MAKESLNGAELADFIKQRQAKQVRSLKQAHGIQPKLAIIRANPDPVVNSYMRLKKGYGKDIGIDVDVHTIEQDQAVDLIKKLNRDVSTNGIIVQLPLPDKETTTEILETVDPKKDVDGLGKKPDFDPATPMAVHWLLTGYNVELKDKKILIIGRGRLVGAPLARMWRDSGYDVTIAHSKTENPKELAQNSDVIVCATGVPRILTAEMIKGKTYVVDAGVATDSNKLIGDVDPSVRELDEVIITPEKGGVGPLTVCALFENVIRSAQRKIKK